MGHRAEGSSAEGGVGAGSGGGEVPEAPGHAHGPREQAGRRETASKPCQAQDRHGPREGSPWLARGQRAGWGLKRHSKPEESLNTERRRGEKRDPLPPAA